MKNAMMKTALVTSLLVMTAAHAEPKPFGLELGKATETQFKQKFPSADLTGISAYTGGKMYKVPSYDLPLKGVQSDIFIFTKDHKLAAVNAVLSKSQFDSLYRALQRKYRLVNSRIPFVGNKSATFQDGKGLVELDAPHMSFEMNLTYLTKEFKQKMQAEQRRKAEEKRRQTESAL